MHSKYRPGPLLGQGSYGIVLGCVEKETRARFACKSVDIKALLASRDGANIERRLWNEIGIMSYLAGEDGTISTDPWVATNYIPQQHTLTIGVFFDRRPGPRVKSQ